MDSGSLVTLVHASLADSANLFSDLMEILCIHGDAKGYPTVVFNEEIPNGGTVKHVSIRTCYTVQNWAVIPLFWELWVKKTVSSEYDLTILPKPECDVDNPI